MGVLARAGSDLCQRVEDYNQISLLCLAAAHGETAVVRALLDGGVRADTRNSMGDLAVVLAATPASKGMHRPCISC